MAVPVLLNGLLSHTLAAAPWNRPRPPRSCMRRSLPERSQLKPTRGCTRRLPSNVSVLLRPKPPLSRVTVVPETLPGTRGAAAAALNSGLVGTPCWSTRAPTIRLNRGEMRQLSCRNRPVLV